MSIVYKVMERNRLFAFYGAVSLTAAGVVLPLSATAQSDRTTQGGQVTPPAPSFPDETITVTGEHLSREEQREQARNLISETGVARGSRPIARWRDAICPHATGISAEHTEMVVAKVRKIAEESGIKVEKKGCQPNIDIRFTNDGAALVTALVKQAPNRISDVDLADRDRLLTGPQPIRWWYDTDVRGSDGMRNSSVASNIPTEGGFGGIPTAGDGAFSHYNSSIISTQSIRVIRYATVIVDVDQVEPHNLSLNTVSDFIAMVSLAEIAQDDISVPGSILSVFARAGGPDSMTALDYGLLKAIYRIRPDREARAQRGSLLSLMSEDPPAK